MEKTLVSYFHIFILYKLKYINMKDIKEYIKSEVILKGILTETKDILPIVNSSFKEWFKEFPNDKGEAEVKTIFGLPNKDRFGNKAIVIASTSFIAGYKEIKKQKQEYLCGIIIIPFENFYIAFQINYHQNEKMDDIGVYAIQPKNVSIKSILNVSKSAFEVYEKVYIKSNDELSEKDIINEIIKYLNKGNFVDKVEKKYGVEAQEENEKAKQPSEDNSPFTLRKKKQFPDYIKHCLIKSKDNAIVKKYSYWDEAEIFVETIKKDGKNYYKAYMGDVRSTFDNGKDELYTFYLTTLGSLDKFLEYTLKPNRQKMHSELGADGEIHVWYSSMQKHLPANLKKDCIKDENLIKELHFHDLDIYDLYNV